MTAVLNEMMVPLGSHLIEDLDVNTTVQENVTLEASIIYYIDVDNTDNSSAVYFKLWDSISPDVSTDTPVYKIKVNANDKSTLVVPEGLQLSTGLSYACTTTSQNGASGAPTNEVKVRIITG